MGVGNMLRIILMFSIGCTLKGAEFWCSWTINNNKFESWANTYIELGFHKKIGRKVKERKCTEYIWNQRKCPQNRTNLSNERIIRKSEWYILVAKIS